MSILNTYTLYEQIREILPQLVNAPGVAVQSPGYEGLSTLVPYYQFRWGERPTKCEKGKPIVFAFMAGDKEVVNSNCDAKRNLVFNLGIALTGESNAEIAAFNNYWNRLQCLFGVNGLDMVYDVNNLTTQGQTLAAPYTLRKIGIAGSRTYGGNRYRRVDGDCSMYVYEMLVEWTVYLALSKTRNIIQS